MDGWSARTTRILASRSGITGRRRSELAWRLWCWVPGSRSGRSFCEAEDRDQQLNLFRIALANIRYPSSPEESIALAEQAIGRASVEGARLICFPECFIPGYRARGKAVPPPDAAF